MLKLTFESNDIADISLEKGRHTIGRDEANETVLSDDSVSGFHAELQAEGGQLFVVDLGSANGTTVNGKPVSGRVKLNPWDKLAFASVEAELVDTDGRRPTRTQRAISEADVAGQSGTPASAQKATRVRAAVSDWNLEGLTGEWVGKQVPVSQRVLVGRDTDCHITAQASELSRRHAEITLKDGQLSVKDLGSTNGTFVNDEKVTERALQNGDEVRFDQVRFRVHGPQTDKRATKVRDAVADPSASTSKATRVSSAVVPTLSIVGGDQARDIPLNKAQLTLGREAGNDVQLQNSSVSGRHAQMVSRDGRWYIEDLGATNGVVRAGKKEASFELTDGATFSIGEVSLRFKDPASTASSGTGATGVVGAVGASAGGGTRVMDSVGKESDTRTSTHQQVSRLASLPGWVYGLIGFLLVGAILALILFWDAMPWSDPAEINAPLQAGSVWPETVKLPSDRRVTSTPALGDINGDGFLDVIVADTNGFVHAFDGAEGKRIFQAQIADRIVAAPVLGDISGDGVTDIVLATIAGDVVAMNGEGRTLWRSEPDGELGAIVNRPALLDVNGDGVDDVIVPSEERGVVALDGSRGWEIWHTAEMVDSGIVSSPLIVDVEGDGHKDIVVVTQDGVALAIAGQDGRAWRVWQNAEMGRISYASPVLLNVGKDRAIVIATDGGGMNALRAENGRFAWQTRSNDSFFASPVATDINGDGAKDIAGITDNGDVVAINGQNGDEIWRQQLGVEVAASPALFDFTNDGIRDLLVLAQDGRMLVINATTGRAALSARLEGADEFIASPVLGDLNRDELVDAVMASRNGQIFAYGFNRSVRRGATPWPVFLGGQGVDE